MKAFLVLLALLPVTAACAGSVVVKKALSSSAAAGVNRLLNGSLDAVAGDQFAHWTAWDRGYVVDAAVAHTGRFSARCESTSADEQRGITYRLELNQKAALPITVAAWSKAKEVSGGANSDYSLYLDLEYVDGTPLWGQVAPFDTGTHDWQQRTVTVIPSQPVKSVTIHGLFRGHTGTAWFDDFRAWSPESGDGVDQFDALPVQTVPQPKKLPAVFLQADSRGDVKVPLAEDGSLVTKAVGGFLLRDVAANSDFVRPQGSYQKSRAGVAWQGGDDRLGLRLSAQYRDLGGAVRIDGKVQDLTGKDRAITVYFTYPIDAVGWNWWDDQRASRRIEAGQTYQNVENIGAGANGSASRYPLACISGKSDALAMAVPLDVPRLVRFGYDANSKELYAAFDLGLSRETAHFPSSASFSLVLYRPDPAWGFRSALERYYALFPNCFTKRNTKEGIWMPFADIEKVKGWEDFGFQFKEGDGNVPFDRAHGIDSFVYVEPMSWWLALPKEVERTPESAFAYAQEQAKAGKQDAQAALASAEKDAQGNWVGDLRDTPWCDGVVYYLNPSPAPGSEATKYGLNWRGIDRAFQQHPQLSGVYVDSFEMAASLRNYRREQFRTAETPLVFDRQGRLCQLGIFNTTEFAKDLAARMWERHLMTFANAIPVEFPWGCAYFDVMGIETNWISDGKYAPPSDATLNYYRALSDQRPYLFLQNTRFEQFPHAWVERYMKRSIAYGIFPSFFSHDAATRVYWERPELYDRDRDLFKKYIPVVKALSAAGWEPVTRARADNPKLYVERFGQPGGPLFFTVFNSSQVTQRATLTFEHAPAEMTEVLSGEKLAVKDGKLAVEIGPEDLRVLKAE